MHLSYRGQSYSSSQSNTRANSVGQSECGVLKYRGVVYHQMAASHQPASGSSMKLTYRGQSYTTHQPVACPHQSAETAPVVLSYRGSLYTRMV